MGQREPVGPKTRFEVFKRDGFSCQYCGGRPPFVQLHADHVIPVADGGTSDIDNLIAACENCNRGKGARLASDLRLKWVPWERTLRPPAGLKDYQQAWFWNLLCASFDEQMQGHLPITSQLWKIAGAHRRDYWETNKSEVVAAFEVRRLENGTAVLFFPPLIELMQSQMQRLRSKKSAGSPLFSTVRAGPSASQSVFDFELKKQNQGTTAPKPAYTQADFDAMDLRKMAKTYDELERKSEARTGTEAMNAKQIFEFVCERAGITVERGLALEAAQKKWPEPDQKKHPHPLPAEAGAPLKQAAKRARAK